ncbi:MAG: hypothetical protein R3Y44_07025 [Rikenellaceae bacterium]
MSQFTLNDSEIRSLITKWSDSVPHHNHRNLGNKIAIQNIRNISAHRMLVSSQNVSRYIVMATEPLRGQSYDNNNYLKEGDIRCWDYQFTPPATYTNQNNYFVVDASKHSIICSVCSGKGVVRCLKCTNGKIVCKTCNGTGNRKTTSSCSSCGGSGSISTYHQECRIDGYRSDNTPIQRYENVRRTTSCSRCGGSGRVESVVYHGCYTCGGSGRVTCPTCNGTALVECKTCIGKGSVLEYAKLHTQLSTHSDDNIICGYMTNGELKIMLKEIPVSDYKNDKVIKSSDGRVLRVDFSTTLQNNTAISMLNKAAAAVKSNGHILFEEVRLMTVEILAIDYSYGNTYYRVFIVDNSHRSVIANDSPIKGSYLELVAQAVESANNEDYDYALATIKK